MTFCLVDNDIDRGKSDSENDILPSDNDIDRGNFDSDNDILSSDNDILSVGNIDSDILSSDDIDSDSKYSNNRDDSNNENYMIIMRRNYIISNVM